jgi:hypothetical protein
MEMSLEKPGGGKMQEGRVDLLFSEAKKVLRTMSSGGFEPHLSRLHQGFPYTFRERPCHGPRRLSIP